MLPRFKETWRISTISSGSSLKSKNKRARSISCSPTLESPRTRRLARSPKSCLTAASLKSESHEYYYRHHRAVADATRIAKGARTSESRRAEPQACCSGQKRGIRNRGSANIDSRGSWKDKMVTAARWPRSTGRDVGPNRPTVGERLRYGRSLAMGLGSSKRQLQSGERR